MLGLIGKKIGMTQAYDAHEDISGVTVLQLGPCPVVQLKDDESDGYTALRIGFGPIATGKLSRPKEGVFKKSGASPHRTLREFRVDDISSYEVGHVLDVSMFEAGERVDVTGRTKGKGFQGTIKRHNFKRGPKTHGQSDRWRAPGSIGHSSDPSRVFKGKKMSGHMGDRRHTVIGLEVVAVDPGRNLLIVKGAVPGAKGGTVIVRKKPTSGK